MKIKIELKQKVIIVSLTGELDHHSANSAREEIEDFIKEKGITNIVFDLSGLDFMDSSGIGLIVGRFKLVSPLGGKVCVVCRGGNTQRIIKMSGIEKLISMHKSYESAIKAVSGGKRI